MYNFQTSKHLHDILINFLEKKAKVVDDENDKIMKKSLTEHSDHKSSASSLGGKGSKYATNNI